MRTLLDGTYGEMVMVNQMLLTFFYFSMTVLQFAMDRVGKQAVGCVVLVHVKLETCRNLWLTKIVSQTFHIKKVCHIFEHKFRFWE